MARPDLNLLITLDVLLTEGRQELVHAIRAVCRGEIYLTPAASSIVVQAYLSRTKPELPELSDRERQVLQLIAEGNTTKEIATTLNIGVKTAESHRQNLMNRLGIHDTAGLVRYAIRHRLTQA